MCVCVCRCMCARFVHNKLVLCKIYLTVLYPHVTVMSVYEHLSNFLWHTLARWGTKHQILFHSTVSDLDVLVENYFKQWKLISLQLIVTDTGRETNCTHLLSSVWIRPRHVLKVIKLFFLYLSWLPYKICRYRVFTQSYRKLRLQYLHHQ